MKHRLVWAPLALFFASVPAAWSIRSGPQMVRLPVDTVLKVKLGETIGSDRSQTGDPFTATVHDSSLPQGTLVRGVVIGAKKAEGDTPGKIGLDFRTLELPDGKQIPISGTPIALDTNSVTHARDGRLVANPHSKNNTGKYVAIGAAGGLLIGSLLGKNVVGGILGAGAGYLLGKKQDKKAEHRDVVLKEGTELGVRLDRGVAVARTWPRARRIVE
jgi:hypothetical protein